MRTATELSSDERHELELYRQWWEKIGTLFDETGAVGAIQQSVLVRPMPSR